MKERREEMTAAAHEAKAIEIAEAYAGRARQRYVGMQDLEALEGAAYYGAAKALASFCPDRQAKFATWAITLVKAAILEEARQQDYLSRRTRARARRNAATDEDLPSWAERPASLEDLGFWHEGDWMEDARLFHPPWQEPSEMPHDPTGDDAVFEAARAEVRALVDRLPERDREAIRLHYWEEKAWEEIGPRLGVSSAGGYHIRIRILEWLRVRMRCNPFTAVEEVG
jgi:RNA polymerase sigma factor (sigma-70 family)